MINLEGFKDSLLEFIEFKGEPLDVDSIYKQCLQPIDRYRIYEVLYQLELEGKVLRLSDGRYIATKAALRKWLYSNPIEIRIPGEMAIEIEETMSLTPGVWKSMDSFISEAIREYIKKVIEIWSRDPRRKRGGSRRHNRIRQPLKT